MTAPTARPDLHVESLASDCVRVDLLPGVGGRVHRITAFGMDVLRTPPEPRRHIEEPFFWGSFPMVPWCNRIPAGLLCFDGRSHQLPRNFGDFAIHGEAYLRPWASPSLGALTFEGGTSDGFPWPYHADQSFDVHDATVGMTLRVVNRGDSPMPAGVGLHPWLRATPSARVRLPANLVYPTDDDAIPTAEPRAVAGDTDLRLPQPVPWGADALWTDLSARTITVWWPEEQVRLDCRFSRAATHVALAAFADLNAVAIEPVSHATDGHRRREAGLAGGIAVLDPGASLALRCELAFSRCQDEDGGRGGSSGA